MNDFAITTGGAARLGFQGLPQRLVSDGLVPEPVMVEALNGARERRQAIVSYLVEYNLADPREIAIAASQEFGAPLLDLDAIQPDFEIVRLVSEKTLRRHRVMPLVKRGKRLFVAVSDPTNLYALDEVKFATGLSVEAVVVEEDKLERMLAKSLEQVDTSMPALAGEDFELDSLQVSSEDETADEGVDRADVEDAPIVRFVNKVMLDAIKRGASDIHFEPYERSYRIRLRLDGVLKEVASPPVQLAVKLAARLKVMRILDPSSAMLGIDALGYEPFQKQLYMESLARPHGMILVTGPTGSGKTVLLYTGLNILNTEDTNISTAEDPVEIMLSGVNQVNINPKVGLTFAGALRAFLRQDPDVIMVGEIRDLETAEIALKAAQTGHLVLSTLHTNDAPKTLTRLMDMGVKPYAIATSVSLIIAQRLARRLCSSCKARIDIPEEALLKEGFTREQIATDLQIFGPVGCPQCTDGYKGRVGIYEVMRVSEEIGRIIMTGGSVLEIREQATAEGVWGLRQSALKKVADGLTTLDEVNRVTVD